MRQTSQIDRVSGRDIGNRDMLILAGSFIPCVLQTAMDSSQPGYVSCIIPRDIYSDNGRVVLLEKGTRVLGEYQTGVQRGKYRLFAVWNRAVTPRGVAIDVGRSEEHTSELQSLMRISYAVFCLQKKQHRHTPPLTPPHHQHTH